ncbi:MAG: glycosyltransferase family 4 protein [Kiritimatiellae bacterium]|jgi:glycosyltransferase involved in cell wall biosynthesis|nr:glycosyltransferase family 4 protein [Kiritimatiellia bacterium]
MIVILQPKIPHYRCEFFKSLQSKEGADIFCYESLADVKKQGFSLSDIDFTHVKSVNFGRFLYYNIKPLLNKKYDTLVLMWTFAHITTWILLILKPIHKKKIILWGHGISIKRYYKEQDHPSLLLKLMAKMADGLWFYTENEKEIWRNVLNDEKKCVALNNTLSDLGRSLTADLSINKVKLKYDYGIHQHTVLIFAARFVEHRRADLLMKAINMLNPAKFAIIIIGDGEDKPDFSGYKNVFDFGAIYDFDKKTELFALADIYFQPAYLGLSVVEALAYGKPVFTLKRNAEILQGVEYGYIQDGITGFIFETLEKLVNKIENISSNEIEKMGHAAKMYVQANLSNEKMVSNAISLLSH